MRWLVALALVACAVPRDAEERIGTQRSAVVYGADDRSDVYATSDARMRTIAENASVVLVWPPYIDESDEANVRPSDKVPTLGAYKKLCTSEPFFDDPAMGSCSGALIDDDLVLTAGHCVPTKEDCDEARIVFHFQKTSSTSLTKLTKDDVFRCTDRLVFKYESDATPKHDYAIVKLDRSATPRFRPTAVRRSKAALPQGNKIGIIGYGNGIPAKVDVGALVLDPGSTELDYFVHTSDAYSGNSGSPVFDLVSYEIAGILVRGSADDFVDTGTCFVNHVCPANGALAEGCTGMSSDYAMKSVDAFCSVQANALAHPKLCAAQSCGNGRCEANETIASCAIDCTPPADAGAPDVQVPTTSSPANDPEPAPITAPPPSSASSSCSITLVAAANPKPAIKLLSLLALALFARRRAKRG